MQVLETKQKLLVVPPRPECAPGKDDRKCAFTGVSLAADFNNQLIAQVSCLTCKDVIKQPVVIAVGTRYS